MVAVKWETVLSWRSGQLEMYSTTAHQPNEMTQLPQVLRKEPTHHDEGPKIAAVAPEQVCSSLSLLAHENSARCL